MQQKKLLIILSRAPYGNAHSKDALDIALTAAAFEQEVALLFCEDAFSILLKSQQPEKTGQKNLASICSALPMYDIETLYVEQRALKENGINASDLILPVLEVDQAAIASLIRESDIVLRF